MRRTCGHGPTGGGLASRFPVTSFVANCAAYLLGWHGRVRTVLLGRGIQWSCRTLLSHCIARPTITELPLCDSRPHYHRVPIALLGRHSIQTISPPCTNPSISGSNTARLLCLCGSTQLLCHASCWRASIMVRMAKTIRVVGGLIPSCEFIKGPEHLS